MYALRERLDWSWLAINITAAGLTPSTRREETVWPSRQRQTVFFTSGPPWMRAMEHRFSVLLICICLWEIHQIHGKGVGQREVFMTLNQEIQASRLIAGLTWGGNGAWTSWPPHQHEADLEEIYCYFDMDEPHFGLHLSYTAPGDVDNIVAHPVKSGSMVLAPRGYHPTVASPGTRNAYFWVLAAHSHESRGYDLAVLDPSREQMN